MTQSLLPILKLFVALRHSLRRTRRPTKQARAGTEYFLAMLARGGGPLELLWLGDHGEGGVIVLRRSATGFTLCLKFCYLIFAKVKLGQIILLRLYNNS